MARTPSIEELRAMTGETYARWDFTTLTNTGAMNQIARKRDWQYVVALRMLAEENTRDDLLTLAGRLHTDGREVYDPYRPSPHSHTLLANYHAALLAAWLTTHVDLVEAYDPTREIPCPYLPSDLPAGWKDE